MSTLKTAVGDDGEQVKLSLALGPKENLCQLWFVKPSEGGSFDITNRNSAIYALLRADDLRA
ncbi:hypothetical protein K525DRAFT_275619 [Schizophyllum commune Loenen D]|nr:hypothetical protein K525DRAFT_275619 [Schizophyllum commune Loenen D]